MNEKSTKELIGIWKWNDRKLWSNEAFEAIREVLLERGKSLPAQRKIETWETLPVPIQKGKQVDAIDSVPAEAFILIHVLVLGVAGFLLGAIAGVYFIGISWKAKMWPGMIALMAASMFGAALC